MRKTFKTLNIILLFLISTHAFCQSGNYNQLAFEVKGDLNKDGLNDIVTVKEDTKDMHRPFLLEIKFQKPDGTFQTVQTSEKVVKERFPFGTQETVSLLDKLEIKKGILIFHQSLIRGTFVHRFRYQNNNFELIGVTYNNASPGYMEHLDFNLMTGKKIYRKKDYETDKVIEENITVEKINPLPNLNDFDPIDYLY